MKSTIKYVSNSELHFFGEDVHSRSEYWFSQSLPVRMRITIQWYLQSLWFTIHSFLIWRICVAFEPYPFTSAIVAHREWRCGSPGMAIWLINNDHFHLEWWYLYIIRCLLLKYRLIFFTSLESIWRAFRRVKYRKTSKKYQPVFQKKAPNNIFIVKFKKITPGVKILGFKSNRRHQDFPKSKIYTNHSSQNILEGVIF